MFIISVIKVVENSFTSLFNMSAILWLMFYSVSQTLTASAPAPEDWVSGSPFSHFSSEDNRADIIVGAYFNITTFDSNTNMWLWDKTEVGRYGGGHVGPAFGEVIHVTNGANQADHSGCQRPFFSSRGGPPPTNHPWIALIKRGRCNFEVKVENAFLSSASGVIVYNDRESSTLDKMKLSSDSGRNISAVFTHKWKGEEIARIIENNHKVYIHISVASQKSSRTANINRTSVLFVSITFIVLMIISLAWLVFYYVQRFRYIHAKDRLSRRLGNAAKKALSKIPTKNIKSEDKEIQGDGECCAICIEPYKLGDILRSLPCSHEFHKNCIDPWLLEHRTCPMCKMDILKHYGFVFTGSQESILQIDGEEVLNLNQENAAPRRNGVSPLPEIHAVIIANHQMLFDNVSADDESSGASTPNEMTPSLPRHFGGSSDICVSCIAAHTIAVSSENINKTSSNSNVSDVLERQSNISDNVNTKTNN